MFIPSTATKSQLKAPPACVNLQSAADWRRVCSPVTRLFSVFPPTLSRALVFFSPPSLFGVFENYQYALSVSLSLFRVSQNRWFWFWLVVKSKSNKVTHCTFELECLCQLSSQPSRCRQGFLLTDYCGGRVCRDFLKQYSIDFLLYLNPFLRMVYKVDVFKQI